MSQHERYPSSASGAGSTGSGSLNERDHIVHSSTGSTSSRNSIATGPPMPSIAEDESSFRASYRANSRPNVIWPRTPLRVPQKSPRRALARAQAQAQAQSRGKAASSASGANHHNGNNSHAAAPPPYVPAATLPPKYRESPQNESGPSSDSSGSSELKATKSTGVASVPSRSSPTPGDSRPELDEKTPGWMDRQWHGSRRSRYIKFGALILVLIALIIGLAVGLTVGMKKGGGGGSSDDADNTSEEPDPVFPAGSYSFETTLQKTSTSCTSRSSTWRCYPYSDNSNATFFWIIEDDKDNKGNFTVSSSENPFAPSFSNLTASVMDADGDNERLIFEFDMAKTVVPDDALTPDNRAAKCTFSDTRFQATMWTKRGSSNGGDNIDTSKRFGAWPGDVEIIQSKKSELGQPVCEDNEGNKIADVQASSGECSCDYANFELD